jgi:hypothetical protein
LNIIPLSSGKQAGFSALLSVFSKHGVFEERCLFGSFVNKAVEKEKSFEKKRV